MTNRLEIPEELQSLIEKRENDERRSAERRSKDSASNDGSNVPQETAAEPAPSESNSDRRSGLDRRNAQRRKQ